jgi:uncharacterized protein (DUF488 family)
MDAPPKQTIWTIGHSNRPIGEFLDLLTGQQIELLADVRKFPGSRSNPQFGQDSLRESLGQRRIEYRHFPELGGRRSRRREGSPNTAWRVEAFNAYADHMQGEEFRRAVIQLIDAATKQRTAIMCSEAVPWRCHRRLIADYLVVQGWNVHDIISGNRVTPHKLTEFAKVSQGEITYPGGTLF